MADMLQRLHDRLDPLGAESKKMFGGVCFMLNGNMVAGTSKRGLLVRTGKEFDGAEGRDDCEVMDMTGRPMFGYWFVKDSIGAEAFEFWMEAALAHNSTLKPK